MSDLLDVLSLDEGMTAIAMTGSGAAHEDTVAAAITAISRRLDALVGPIVVRTITDEIHYPSGNSPIWLDHQPVSSITSLIEYSSGTGTALTAEDYDTSGTYLLRDGMIVRRSGFYTTSWYGSAVKVTYVAGRYATTAAVDARFKTAAAAILRRWWAREAPAWARGGDPFAQEGGGIGFFQVVMPVVQEFLADEMLPPAVA